MEVDFNGKDTVELDASTGLLLEWGYSFNEHSTIAIRYASVDYEVSGIRNSDKIDGNYIGAMFYWYFGQ